MKTILALILLFNKAAVNAAQPTAYIVDSRAGFSDAIERVKQAVVNHYFRVVRLSEKKGEPAAEFCTRGYRAIG